MRNPKHSGALRVQSMAAAGLTALSVGLLSAPAHAQEPDPAACNSTQFAKILTTANKLTAGSLSYSDELDKLVSFPANVQPFVSQIPALPAGASKVQKAAYRSAQAKEDRARERKLRRAINDLTVAKDRALQDAEDNQDERARAIDQNFDAASAQIEYLNECIQTRAQADYTHEFREAENAYRAALAGAQDTYIKVSGDAESAQVAALTAANVFADSVERRCAAENKANPPGAAPKKPKKPKKGASKKAKASYSKKVASYNDAKKKHAKAETRYESQEDRTENCIEAQIDNPQSGFDPMVAAAEAQYAATTSAADLALSRAQEDAELTFARLQQDLDAKYGKKQIAYEEAVRILDAARENADARAERTQTEEVRTIEDAFVSGQRLLEDLYDVDLES